MKVEGVVLNFVRSNVLEAAEEPRDPRPRAGRSTLHHPAEKIRRVT